MLGADVVVAQALCLAAASESTLQRRGTQGSTPEAGRVRHWPGVLRGLACLAHPTVVPDLGKGALHHPTAQQRYKPLGGKSLSQSAFTPSFNHCLAHFISPSLEAGLEAGLRGRSTGSTLHPKVFSIHPLPLSSLR
jgi:hypothetical protein